MVKVTKSVCYHIDAKFFGFAWSEKNKEKKHQYGTCISASDKAAKV